jgi:hypothetical protein
MFWGSLPYAICCIYGHADQVANIRTRRSGCQYADVQIIACPIRFAVEGLYRSWLAHKLYTQYRVCNSCKRLCDFCNGLCNFLHRFGGGYKRIKGGSPLRLARELYTDQSFTFHGFPIYGCTDHGLPDQVCQIIACLIFEALYIVGLPYFSRLPDQVCQYTDVQIRFAIEGSYRSGSCRSRPANIRT